MIDDWSMRVGLWDGYFIAWNHMDGYTVSCVEGYLLYLRHAMTLYCPLKELAQILSCNMDWDIILLGIRDTLTHTEIL